MYIYLYTMMHDAIGRELLLQVGFKIKGAGPILSEVLKYDANMKIKSEHTKKIKPDYQSFYCIALKHEEKKRNKQENINVHQQVSKHNISTTHVQQNCK
jgi:hypothetical protein